MECGVLGGMGLKHRLAFEVVEYEFGLAGEQHMKFLGGGLRKNLNIAGGPIALLKANV